MFGPACELIGAEALVRLPDALPEALLLLGQRGAEPLDSASRLRIAAVPRREPRRYAAAVDAQSLTDARALAVRLDSMLRLERRASAHTVRAYVATAYRLLDFLSVHRGEPPDGGHVDQP